MSGGVGAGGSIIPATGLDHVFMFSKNKMLAGVSGLKDSPMLARIVAISGKNVEPIVSAKEQGETSEIIWRD